GALLAVEGAREDAGRRGLAAAARPGEQVRVVDAPRGERGAQRLGDVFLPDHLCELRRAVLAVQSQRHGREATHHRRHRERRGTRAARRAVRTARRRRADRAEPGPRGDFANRGCATHRRRCVKRSPSAWKSLVTTARSAEPRARGVPDSLAREDGTTPHGNPRRDSDDEPERTTDGGPGGEAEAPPAGGPGLG